MSKLRLYQIAVVTAFILLLEALCLAGVIDKITMVGRALAEFGQVTTSRVYQVGGRGASATISRYTRRSRGGTLKCWYPVSMRPRFLGTRAICRTNALALPGCIRNIRQFPQLNREQPAARAA